MKKKVFSVKKFILFVFLLCLIIGASLIGTYFYCINYSYDGKEVSIEVVDGDSYATIGNKLKEKNLILRINICIRRLNIMDIPLI